jgi:TonB family protein
VASAQGLARRGLSGLPGSPLSAITAEDAARAARSALEGGDGGAGFNNDGGFVDNGPLSFDTKNYDWSSYAAEMVRRIKRHWEIPGLAHYGVKGYLIIKFFIRRDGTVEDVRILQPSGSPPYDNAAVMAIRTSNPFKPLPADLNSDREGVTIGFFYNMRPEEVPSWNR